MGTFLTALEVVLPLFLVIGTGFVFSRSKAFNPQWIDILNKYALYVGFPALVVASLMKLEPNPHLFKQLILHTSLYTLGCMFLAFPVARLFKLSRKMLRTLFLVLPFGNFAYLGIPVIQSAYGDKMLPTAAILSAVYLFWLLSIGIVLIEAYGEDKLQVKTLVLNLLKNPLLLSVFVGLGIALLQIKLPFALEKTVQLFSNSVTAIILFALGLFLGTQELGKLRDWTAVALLVLVTMFVFPACYYLYLQFTGMESILVKASILDAAMPLGLTPYVLASQYKLEDKLAARVVVLGTALSVVILPLWMVWMG